STLKSPSYTKSVSWQHYRDFYSYNKTYSLPYLNLRNCYGK
ncbi:transposase, partial [Shigella flexneri]